MAMNDETSPTGAEDVITLQGLEGIGKTLPMRRLSILRSINCWICELGELDSTSRKDQSALKSHLTAVSDNIREPYARTATQRVRRTSYCATVNPSEFLTSSTGNRRYQTLLPGEEELLQMLDWGMPMEQWQYFKAPKAISLIAFIPGFSKITPMQMGKVLLKIAQTHPQVTCRNARSNVKEYLLPIHACFNAAGSG